MGCGDVTNFFFFQAEDGIRDWSVTGVQTCALPIWDIGSDVEKMLTNFSKWKADRAKGRAALEEDKTKRREERAKRRAALASPLPDVAPQHVGPLSSRKIFSTKPVDDALTRAIARIPAAPGAEPEPKAETRP